MCETDAAIIGAGPAGAFAAWRLARAGARVLLVDPSHPREKPCGGGVTRRALSLVAEAVDPATLPAVAIRRARLVDSASGRSATVSLEDAPGDGLAPLVVARRMDFDAALVDAAARAGATLVQERAIDVSTDGRTATITTARATHRARFLIGADGATSIVRRRLAHPFPRGDLSIATGFFAHGATSDEILIELVADPPGYIWSFPRPTHLAIGICAQADAGASAGRLRDATRRWMAAAGVARGATLEAYSWPIPSLGVGALAALELAGPNWCLIGDAAGLVDPITREGIYYALVSGALAADAALRHDPRGYAAAIRGGVVPELQRAAELKAGFFRPRFAALLLTALARSAAVRGVMADLVTGAQPYAGLKSRLFRTFEWRLGWQVLARRGRLWSGR